MHPVLTQDCFRFEVCGSGFCGPDFGELYIQSVRNQRLSGSSTIVRRGIIVPLLFEKKWARKLPQSQCTALIVPAIDRCDFICERWWEREVYCMPMKSQSGVCFARACSLRLRGPEESSNNKKPAPAEIGGCVWWPNNPDCDFSVYCFWVRC